MNAGFYGQWQRHPCGYCRRSASWRRERARQTHAGVAFALRRAAFYKPAFEPAAVVRPTCRAVQENAMPASAPAAGRAIVTIIGLDRVGIIAAVATALSEANVNILDISQSVLRDEVFTMIMMVDLAGARVPYEQLSRRLKDIGSDLKVQVEVQREDIFKAMHRI
jgi:ACT domain-containing protein